MQRTLDPNLMADKKIIKAIRHYLDGHLDCSSVSESNRSQLTFDYVEGSNEGCYITLGEHEYRCHVCDPFIYTQAISVYCRLMQIANLKGVEAALEAMAEAL